MPRGDGTGAAGKGPGTGRGLGRAVVVAGWVAADSEQGENAYAQIVAIRLPINRVSPVMRLSVPNAGQQWQGNYKYV